MMCAVSLKQMVLITDPALAMHVLYSQHFDKFRFAYSFLDPVCLTSFIVLAFIP